MRCYFQAIILLILPFFITGCGYTTGSLLPPNLKNIYVENFVNKIELTEETSDRRVYKTYRPMLEVDITKAIIDKFIFDGHLKITQKQDADIVLEGELWDFRREPTRYGEADNIEQYRLAIIVNMKLKDAKKNEVIWQEKGFAGSAYYYTTGTQAKSEGAAMADAIDDLARRVVERTIEVW